MRPPFEQFYAYRRLFPIAELTPDGRRVLYVSDLSGQFNLWSVSVEGGRPEQLTTFVDQSVRGIAVRGDGAILFMADSNGDEFHQLYRIPPEGGWPEQLTSLPQVQHAISAAAWSPDGSAFAFAANSRKPTDSEIFIWHEGEPEARWLFGEDMLAYAGPWSPDGTRLVAIEVRTPTALRLHVVDVASGHAHELPSHEEEANIMPGPWAADGSGFYLYSNEGRELPHSASIRSNAMRSTGSRSPTATSRPSRHRKTAGCSRGSRMIMAGRDCAFAMSSRAGICGPLNCRPALRALSGRACPSPTTVRESFSFGTSRRDRRRFSSSRRRQGL